MSNNLFCKYAQAKYRCLGTPYNCTLLKIKCKWKGQPNDECDKFEKRDD